MTVTIADVTRPTSDANALVEVERTTHDGMVLAVARRSSGALVLCRERKVTPTVKDSAGNVVKGDDGKPLKADASTLVLKPTADLADIAAAFASGLLE